MFKEDGYTVRHDPNKPPFQLKQNVVIKGPMDTEFESTVIGIKDKGKYWSVTFVIQDPDKILDMSKVVGASIEFIDE